MDVARNVLALVGNTPMVWLDNVRKHDAAGKPVGARVAAKLEMFNPGSSVKDRIGLPLIRAGERAGLLKPGGTIVEPTSGNTGLGLAMAATLLGYRMVCTLPDKVPLEKQNLLKAYGAEVVVCPTNVDPEDPRSYYKQAERMRDEEGAYLPYQYYNPANPGAHQRTTGPEIWRQTDGKVTHLVAGMGTGGTISGTGKYLHAMARKAKRSMHVTAADTDGSVFAYYHKHRRLPPADRIHQYLIDGIGEDFMPTTVWWDEIDAVATVSDADAYLMQARLAREEALFSGSSAGAAVHAAVELAATLPKSALVVTIIPDIGDRYLSKFNVAWLESKGLTKAAAYLRDPPARPSTTVQPKAQPVAQRNGKAAKTAAKRPLTESAPTRLVKRPRKTVRVYKRR